MTTVVTIHSMETRFNITLELYKVMIPLNELFPLIPVVVFTQVKEKTYPKLYNTTKASPKVR